MAPFLWDPSFFVFSPENIGHIRKSIFYLVEWGFDYKALVQMPIEEFLDYSKLLYKNRRDKSDAEERALDGSSSKKPDGHSIGQVTPGSK